MYLCMSSEQILCPTWLSHYLVTISQRCPRCTPLKIRLCSMNLFEGAVLMKRSEAALWAATVMWSTQLHFVTAVKTARHGSWGKPWGIWRWNFLGWYMPYDPNFLGCHNKKQLEFATCQSRKLQPCIYMTEDPNNYCKLAGPAWRHQSVLIPD